MVYIAYDLVHADFIHHKFVKNHFSLYSCCRWFCSPSFMRQIHIAIVYVVQTACPKFLVRVLCPVLITYSSCFGVMDHVGDKGHSVSIIVAGWYPNLLVRLCPSIPLVVVTSPFPLPLPKDTCTNLYDWFPLSDSANFWWSYHLQINASPSLYVPYPCDNREVSTHNWPMLVLAVILTGGYPQSLPMPSHSWWFRFFFGLSEHRIPANLIANHHYHQTR